MIYLIVYDYITIKSLFNKLVFYLLKCYIESWYKTTIILSVYTDLVKEH